MADMVYYDRPDGSFFVVYDYRLLDEDPVNYPPLKTRVSRFLGMNEVSWMFGSDWLVLLSFFVFQYQMILGRGSVVNPGFYFAVRMGATLIEDPDNFLHGKILGESDRITVWVRSNDFEKRVAKFRITALDDSSTQASYDRENFGSEVSRDFPSVSPCIDW